MRITSALAVVYSSLLLLSAHMAPAAAEPKGEHGEKCDSSETGVKKTINGKQYTCDKCTYKTGEVACQDQGKQIGCGPVVKTHWDCKEVASMIPGGKATVSGAVKSGAQILPDKPPKKPKLPTVNTPAINSAR
jgi:hypothetical protein